MNGILHRFKQIEREARNPDAELEAVQNGDAIVFQIGKGRLGCGLWGFTCLAIPLSLALSWVAYTELPLPVNWIAAGSILILMLRWIWSVFRFNMTHRTLFVINTSEQELVIHPWPWQRPYQRNKGEQQRLGLDDIDYFLDCWDYSGDPPGPHGGALLAALKDGSACGLTHGLQSLDTVKKNTRLLGQVCDKLALSVDKEEVNPYDFIEVNIKGVHGSNREKLLKARRVNKDKLLQVATILYTPAACAGPQPQQES